MKINLSNGKIKLEIIEKDGRKIELYFKNKRNAKKYIKLLHTEFIEKIILCQKIIYYKF